MLNPTELQAGAGGGEGGEERERGRRGERGREGEEEGNGIQNLVQRDSTMCKFPCVWSQPFVEEILGNIKKWP